MISIVQIGIDGMDWKSCKIPPRIGGTSALGRDNLQAMSKCMVPVADYHGEFEPSA